MKNKKRSSLNEWRYRLKIRGINKQYKRNQKRVFKKIKCLWG